MIKSKLLIILLVCLILSGCSNTKEPEDEIIYGEIDETKNYYPEEDPLPSLTERVDKLDIKDYYIKVPLNITKEVVQSTLPDFSGTEYFIERIQLNGVYFDINEIANMSNYNYYVDDKGIFNIIIPYGDIQYIEVELAEIYDGDTFIVSDEDYRQLRNIMTEYTDIYQESKEQISSEYGSYYTYPPYVEFLNSHENFKKDISVYDSESILELLIDIFNIDGCKTDDFLTSTNPIQFEYSTWYEITNKFYTSKEDGYIIELAVKRNANGVFAWKIKYPVDATLDNYGEDYYTPDMIINFAQNNYQQLAETYNRYVERENLKYN